MNPFFLDQKLCLQFILNEIVLISRKIHKLEKNNPEDKTCFFKNLQIFDEILSPFTDQLNPNGSLDRLVSYCNVLSRVSKKEHKEFTAILERMKSKVLIQKTHLISIKDVDVADTEKIKHEIKNLILFLHSALKKIFALLIPFLEENQKDENVLMCLIKLREELDQILAPDKIHKLLLRFYPNGLEELKNLIVEKYKKRSFSKYLSMHAKMLEELCQLS